MEEMCWTDPILSGVGGSGGVTHGGVASEGPGEEGVGLLEADEPPERGPKGAQG